MAKFRKGDLIVMVNGTRWFDAHTVYVVSGIDRFGLYEFSNSEYVARSGEMIKLPKLHKISAFYE